MRVEIKPDGNRTLLELLSEKGVKVPADCSGNGRCGKCRVRVISGEVPVTKTDMTFFSASKYLEGYRIACAAVPVGTVVCEVDEPEGTKILTSFDGDPEETETEAGFELAGAHAAKCPVHAAVDIGTTTIAAVLYDNAGQRLGSGSALNPQKKYGADVISRISAARSGKADEMKFLVSETIKNAILGLLERLNLSPDALETIAIAGNTTMLHILRGMSCEGLAAYPFSPVSVDHAEPDGSELFGDAFEKARITVFPGISAFVGADIVAGIYGLEMDKGEENRLLMDLGTNGELALRTKEGYLCSSSSAGPAFEGSELSCGMAGMEGAVESVRIVQEEDGVPGVFCRVIGGGSIKGLCGSGALELLSELVRLGYVDENGTFTEEYFYDGFPFGETKDGTVLAMTQLDVRALQLAKSAVRAASELLLERAGVTKPHIILAGGMGTFIEPERLGCIGMFPEAGSISFAGNTSLMGLKRYICEKIAGREKEAVETLINISRNAFEVNVSGDPGFQEKFIGFMGFENGKSLKDED